jgi:hypothetical protein
MFRHSLRPYTWLGGLTALFLAITAVAGLFVKDIYRPFIPAELIASQYVQDAISLLTAPALVATMVFTHRGSARASVLWAGLLVYTAYYYAFYAFDHVVTVVYPLYIALVGLAVYGLIGLLASIDVAAFAGRVRGQMPVRFIASVLGVTLLFVPLWLLMIAQDIAASQARATATVFVLDLAFLIPACTLAAPALGLPARRRALVQGRALRPAADRRHGAADPHRHSRWPRFRHVHLPARRRRGGDGAVPAESGCAGVGRGLEIRGMVHVCSLASLQIISSSRHGACRLPSSPGRTWSCGLDDIW